MRENKFQGLFSCPITEQPDTEKPKPELKMRVTFCFNKARELEVRAKAQSALKGKRSFGFKRSIPKYCSPKDHQNRQRTRPFLTPTIIVNMMI